MEKNTQYSYSILNLLDKHFKPLDTREIYEWAKDNVYLPPGRGYETIGYFDVNKSRYLIEVFKALKDDNIRTVAVYKSIQTAGTLLGDIFIPWIISNCPGPIQLSFATDEMVKIHVNNRLYPLLKNVKSIKHLVPEQERDLTNTGVQFPHMTLYCNGEKESAFQAKSIQYAICDEVHLYDRGRLDQALNRTSAFDRRGNSKHLIISQPGEELDDMDKIFVDGTQEHWCVRCEGCKEYFYPVWREQRKDGSYYGMLWDSNEITRPDGKRYNIPETLKTVRYECVHCGHKHLYSKELFKRWNDTGKYVSYNNTGNRVIRSFRWNAIPLQPWDDLVTKYLKARELQEFGIHENIINFYQQQIAKPKNSAMKEVEKGFIRTEVYNVADKWEDGFIRFMTIDVQKYHFWVVIREWACDGRSRQLYFGKCETVNEIKDLQAKNGIANNCVFVDCSWSEKEGEVHKIWEMIDSNMWVGLKGANQWNMDGFDHKSKRGEDVKLFYSVPKRFPNAKNRRFYFEFATTPICNILEKLRDGKSHEFKCLENEEYTQQMFAEKLTPVKDKFGQVKFRYVNRDAKPNHAWDCEKMQIVIALMHPHINLIGEEKL